MGLYCLLCVGTGERYLAWSTESKLVWEDFAGPVDEASTFKAFTQSKISMGWECDGSVFTFNAVAKFDRENSWKGDGLTDELLAHEQLHFDLAELYARKMRKHFSNLPNACNLPVEEIQAQGGKFLEDWGQREKLYDRETQHSKNRQEQQRWQAMVAQELSSLGRYAVN